MSADYAITYTSVHSEARSWSIPSEDPYEEAAQQLLEQAPRSPEYIPDPMELEDHVPVYIPEPEHPEDLVPAEDEAPTPLLPPFFLSPRESSTTAAAGDSQDPYGHKSITSLVDTMETRFRDTKRRMMTALEMVDMRVSYQVDVHSRESSEFYSRHHDAQKDRAAVRAEMEVLKERGLAYSKRYQDRQDWPRSDSSCRALEATSLHLETEVRRHEWQHQAADDSCCSDYLVPRPRVARACVDIGGHGGIDLLSWVFMGHTITEAQLQALIDQGVAAAMAEAEASKVRNGYNSNASCQVKFATCTLQDDALTWWNFHVKTTTPEAAHAMPWVALKKMMTDKYCPRGKIKKIETEMWNLKVKGTDVVAYSRRFQQLALMCAKQYDIGECN
ncbi:putative reverse transcriptase domain-containing protein [Tanacetum coccineum]